MRVSERRNGGGWDRLAAVAAAVAGVCGRAVMAWLLVAGVASAQSAPTVTPLVNQSSFLPGQTLRFGASVTNPGGGPTVDFYVGVQLPDGISAVTARLGAGPVAGTLANLAGLVPTAPGVSLAGAFAVSEPALLSHTFTGGEPPGTYTVFVAAVRAGGLRDGVLDPGDLLAFATQTFTYGVGSVLLTGDDSSPALDATVDFKGHDTVPASAISTDEAGLRVARTQIEVAFQPNATVGQVNAALVSVGGRIVSMLRGVAIVLVEVPDPGTLAGLEALMARLRQSPFVRHVRREDMPAFDALPPNFSPGSADLDKIDHLMVTRAVAAWNTAAALDRPGVVTPLLLVADTFGGGQPGAVFDAETRASNFALSPLNRHGYHVLGIMAATNGGDTSDAGLATGVLPRRFGVTPVDTTFGNTWGSVMHDILLLAGRAAGNIVVNTSLGFLCNTAAQAAAECSPQNARAEAVGWLERMRGTAFVTLAGAGLERRFVHAASAGNTDAAGRDALTSSPFTAAALRDDLVTADGRPIANANNVLVTENHLNVVELRACLAASSKRVLSRTVLTNLRNVSAPGTDIWSLTNASTTAANLDGTSMASPQVAALAGWIWALRPSLTNQEVISIILRTAVTQDGCGADDPAPSVDVYSAVLGTDTSLADAPVRKALLDVGGAGGSTVPDGVFNEADLQQFVQAFATQALDFSRFDLNGDGFTGLTTTRPFDLDLNLRFESAARTTGPVTRTVDERAATDIDILCHYAYLSLYTGDTEQRRNLVGAMCGEGGFPGELTRIVSEVVAFAGAAPGDRDLTREPNGPLRNVSASGVGRSASVSNVTNTFVVTGDTPTSAVVTSTLAFTATATGGDLFSAASGTGTQSLEYVVTVPPSHTGTAGVTVSLSGGDPFNFGSLAIVGPGVFQDIPSTQGTTVNVTLQPGVYVFSWGFSGGAIGTRPATRNVTGTFRLTANLTPMP